MFLKIIIFLINFIRGIRVFWIFLLNKSDIEECKLENLKVKKCDYGNIFLRCWVDGYSVILYILVILLGYLEYMVKFIII